MIRFDDVNNWLCPICESGMVVDYSSPPDRMCKNGCFVAHVDYGEDHVFGVTIGFDSSPNWGYYNTERLGYEVISERIKYWKEDYRYLAEILERS